MEETIHAPDGDQKDEFGMSVAFVDGKDSQDDTALGLAVGAPSYDEGAKTDSGAVYFFVRDVTGQSPSWLHRGRQGQPMKPSLSPPSLKKGDNYGLSLSCPITLRNRLVAGAPFADKPTGPFSTVGVDCGAIYVHDISNLTNPVEKFQTYCPNPTAGNNFGFSVSANRNQFGTFCYAVGAPKEKETSFDDVGAVYHYKETVAGGIAYFVQRHIDSCWEEGAQFGFSVSLSKPRTWSEIDVPRGQHMVVGAPYDNEYAINDGSASVFLQVDTTDQGNVLFYQRDKLRCTQILPLEDLTDAWFGYSVQTCLELIPGLIGSTDPHAVFVGAPGRDRLRDGFWKDKVGVVEHFVANHAYPTTPPLDCGPYPYPGTAVLWFPSNDPIEGFPTDEQHRFGSVIAAWSGDLQLGVISQNQLPVFNSNTYYFEKILPEHF